MREENIIATGSGSIIDDNGKIKSLDQIIEEFNNATISIENTSRTITLTGDVKFVGKMIEADEIHAIIETLND